MSYLKKNKNSDRQFSTMLLTTRFIKTKNSFGIEIMKEEIYEQDELNHQINRFGTEDTVKFYLFFPLINLLLINQFKKRLKIK